MKYLLSTIALISISIPASAFANTTVKADGTSTESNAVACKKANKYLSERIRNKCAIKDKTTPTGSVSCTYDKSFKTGNSTYYRAKAKKTVDCSAFKKK